MKQQIVELPRLQRGILVHGTGPPGAGLAEHAGSQQQREHTEYGVRRDLADPSRQFLRGDRCYQSADEGRRPAVVQDDPGVGQGRLQDGLAPLPAQVGEPRQDVSAAGCRCGVSLL